MSHNGNKRIIKNTLMLYFRMFLIMLVTLYTSRVVLEALGVDDYGIYNVVGGLVSAFSILTNSLSSVGARFISFHLGTGEIKKIKNVVSNTVNIQIYLSLIILIVCETVGLYLLYNKLNIPIDRQYSAFWVYQFSVFSFVVKLLGTPYNALIIAYEKMSVYAYISIIEVILQLGLVYCLLITTNDKLILYSILMFGLSLAITTSYFLYCKIKFDVCYYRFGVERTLFKEMAAYAGWNFIGLSSGILKNQGVDIIVNIYFGVTVNAARGITAQVNNAITKFSQNFMTALNPQITQSYAASNWDRFHFLITQGAKFSYFLMLFICMPIFLEMDYILHLWLTVVPPHTCNFARLQIILSLITVLSNTNITAMLATGKIRNYQLIVGTISLLNLPVSLFFLHHGASASWTYLIAIPLEFVCLVSRLMVSRKLTKLKMQTFCSTVLYKVISVTLIALLIPLCTYKMTPQSFSGLALVVVVSFLSTAGCIYIIGLSKSEQLLIKGIILNKFGYHDNTHFS